ncbi:gephyrin-like molybdotransferase Glp [Pseudalkalibacillus caeni]|uniref:Molybdopterin molybdenumtransferase n=1 Tax=Exobacillus caeni TaxID=2574798 RepID=A0A5R9F2E3_9BACL|nr:gephyrin-like molybdotransferase Glp [Pseudalkalibacillus caeni]TLS37842.1 molybdopterin molybdotransferase MoeA [Pseudalkalibacillus caeni]
MVERRKPIPINEAVERVMKFSFPGTVETVLLEECDDRYLADDLLADHDVPPFDRSPYDGFAIRAVDSVEASRENPVELEVVEEIGAGTVAKKRLQTGQATRIMTGAALPEGANAIVMLELVQERTEGSKKIIVIKRPFKQGDSVSFKGEDTEKGTALVSKGTRITPGVKALLATFGYNKVPVHKKPVVGIYATGTELLDIEEELSPGKIRNSNSYMIQSQIKKAGGEPILFGKLEDDFEVCFQSIKNAIEKVDFLITTGGVSVGDFDYLPAIYEKLGAEVLFNKVAMRPGSVTTVAQLDGKLLFGLSGNPSACFVGCELFVRPILKSFMGSIRMHLQKEQAVLQAEFPKPNPFTRLVRSKATMSDGRLSVKPTGLDKSGVVTSLAGANALMMLPGGTRGFQQGDNVHVLLLDEEGSPDTWE